MLLISFVLLACATAVILTIVNASLLTQPFDYSTCRKSLLIMGGVCGPRGSAGLNLLIFQLPATFVGFLAGMFGLVGARSRRHRSTCLVGLAVLVLSAVVTVYYFAKFDK